MKCPVCKGVGAVGPKQEMCLNCHGAGVVKQTREEYLRQCTRAQMVSALYKMVKGLGAVIIVNDSDTCAEILLWLASDWQEYGPE